MINYFKDSNTRPFAVAIVILFVLLVIAMISFCCMDYNKAAEPEHSIYPLTAQIVELDHNADVVVCVDGTGNCWEFYGIEDWQVGDFASLLMDNNGTTETVYDDIITMACYAGNFEG